MCQIAGWLGIIGDKNRVANSVAQSLHHRSPDAKGTKHWEEATLIHTRLGIIDLSPLGAQPMANEDGTVWVVFNGEIYNHLELQRELETKEHVFRGRSDTEVLPHLYEEYGSSFLIKLRGIFAIAIYDVRKKSLILARDRFGIKPLFFGPGLSQLAFASEINALRRVPGINLQPDPQAIHDFAALFYIPAPETFYTGIKALQPGEFLEARLYHEKLVWGVNTFYNPSITPDFSLTLEKAVEQAGELLTKAVQSQLESDVPLGALLSGGIDSSLVSTAAQNSIPGGIQTFNVKFPDAQYDETWATLAVAKHIHSRHLTLNMNENQGTWEHITSLLLHAGQPFADTSYFAVNSVCSLIHKHITVVLSGDGGDEGFGGYNLYWQIDRIRRLQKLPEMLKQIIPRCIAPFSHLGVIRRARFQRFTELIKADDVGIIQNLFCMIRENEHVQLCHNKDILPIRRFFEPQWEYHLGNSQRLERLSARAHFKVSLGTLPFSPKKKLNLFICC